MQAEQLRAELNQMCNDVFETLELQRYFASPLTWPGHRAKSAMMRRYFVPTNRHCWAHVMGNAPIDVKQVIWKHEEDELIFDPRLNGPHVSSDDERPERGSADGAEPEAIEPPSGVLIAMFARVQYAKNSPWLAGLAASHIMERINDPTVINGPALVQRGVDQMIKDLKVAPDQIHAGARVHLDADIEHATLTWSAFERHVRDDATRAQAIEGARFGLDCFRVYASAVGDLMAKASQRKNAQRRAAEAARR